MDHMIVPVVGIEDAATCVRPANENVQERFDYKLMNEPYLLRKNPGKEGETHKRQEKENHTKGGKCPNEKKTVK